MKTDNRNLEKDRNRDPASRTPQQPTGNPERFPESAMTKDSRKDAEQANEKKKEDTTAALASDVAGTVGSRATGSSPEDIAGVADLDQGMRRAKKQE